LGTKPTAPPARDRLAAVVLNFRTPELTRRAIGALLDSRRKVDELILVDNDPDSSCRELAFRADERVTYLPNEANLGFTGGMNRGIRYALDAGAQLVLLVNSDTVLPPEALGRLERALAEHPEAGIAAPILLAYSDPRRVASAGFRFHHRSGRVRQVGFGSALDEIATPRWQSLTAASGCVLLVRRELFERVGLFDEDFFFSFEDLELCLRARRADFETGLVGDARVLHEGGASIPDASPIRFYFAARNHLLAAARGAPLRSPVARALRFGCIFVLNVAHALRAHPGRLLTRLGAVFAGTRDFLRGRFGPAGRDPSPSQRP
jgi:GT2 family glycosyltransferase